jgi:hypothetical protein
LDNEDLGHTAVIHTRSLRLVERFGLEISASRILVNAGGSQGYIRIGNGLVPSLTLGCGTLGGSFTTDNVSYIHLLKTVALARALGRSLSKHPGKSLRIGGDLAGQAKQGQAWTQWPGFISRHAGSTSAAASTACGQRVRNRHPEGGFTGLGRSPMSTTRSRSAS